MRRLSATQFVPKCGVAEWYRTFTWLILALLVIGYTYGLLVHLCEGTLP